MRQVKTSQPRKKLNWKTGSLDKVIEEKIFQSGEEQERKTGGKIGQQMPAREDQLEVAI